MKNAKKISSMIMVVITSVALFMLCVSITACQKDPIDEAYDKAAQTVENEQAEELAKLDQIEKDYENATSIEEKKDIYYKFNGGGSAEACKEKYPEDYERIESMTETELDDEFYSQLKLSRAMNGDK